MDRLNKVEGRRWRTGGGGHGGAVMVWWVPRVLFKYLKILQATSKWIGPRVCKNWLKVLTTYTTLGQVRDKLLEFRGLLCVESPKGIYVNYYTLVSLSFSVKDHVAYSFFPFVSLWFVRNNKKSLYCGFSPIIRVSTYLSVFFLSLSI